MRVSIFGMGYVGCVSAGCLTDLGHEVVAVEPNETKLKLLEKGQSPIIEQGLSQLIKRAVTRNLLRVTANWKEAVLETDLCIVCVGTPSRANGGADLGAVVRVCEQIGKALKEKIGYFVVVIRSTVFPGTVEEKVIPILERESGKQGGTDFGVCMNPEFLREGTAIEDFHAPPKTVIGELDSKSGDTLVPLYKELDAPLVRTSLRVAEMVKFADNAFHALKIAFANEIGTIAHAIQVDSHKVMEIFCLDRKLNISSAYLKPGFAFGGSCLPKDVRSLCYQARINDIAVPVMDSILPSNKLQVGRLVNRLSTWKGRCIGFLGLSFKEGTDDLRESPLVETIETLIGKGFRVRVFDQNVSMARLMGANKDFIEREIPHIADLLCASSAELCKSSDVIVIGVKDQAFVPSLKRAEKSKSVIDLVRLFSGQDELMASYFGFCW